MCVLALAARLKRSFSEHEKEKGNRTNFTFCIAGVLCDLFVLKGSTQGKKRVQTRREQEDTKAPQGPQETSKKKNIYSHSVVEKD